MENFWFIFIVSLCICAILKSLFNLVSSSSSSTKNKDEVPLPPGPTTFPVIGSLLWLRKSFAEIEPIIRATKNRYGPIVSLRITSRPSIFVGSHSLAHRALVQNGAVFSDRPAALPTAKIFNSNQHNISSAAYGPTWRLLRRNLTAEILHPSRVKSYSRARLWVLGILVQRLQNHEPGVPVVEHFRYAMFGLLLLMCFGGKLNETQIQDVENIMRKILLGFGRFQMLNFFPRLGKILFRKRWKELLQMRQEQENVLLPLIKARTQAKRQGKQSGSEDEEVVAYLDTLLGLQLPDEKRELNDGEIVSLCSEFLNAGTDTTTTALQWIMANLVKYPAIQDKLYNEIVSVVGPPRGESQMFDITGSKEIKMMPFGAGRRVCPGLNLALLHLEYFVANLIWQFEWKAVEGDDVDLSEKQEFTTVMKNPLRALITPRVQSI
ncbi:OLC1v1026793C1 [Oldenlandia corymbosa var. corymbosa]|uniref:OLC1v1026793C1 n=1 Tax=Oldenlandia corymbosa var. corymbosa TaxID=529605 RepID=A0AAV1C8M5_OLDCO|nr:OLC1v1026793C1 [Oldenlandia corymbosa var. corymbosa]